MAETTERAAESPAATPAELAAATGGAETYQPLSLIAVLGFSLAALYGLIVGICTVFAFFGRTPLLMPTWTILCPLVALALCWIARTQIQGSEGTQSGLPLTTWGAAISLFVGLTYWAYYTATALAVRHQATECAEKWFALLKQSNNDFDKQSQAFAMTQKQAPKTDDPKWRTTLETRFNAAPSDFNRPGAFSELMLATYVRFLQEAGDKAKIHLLRIDDWTHQGTGYVVRAVYHVETPVVEFDMIMTIKGDWSPKATTRHWYIDSVQGATGILSTKLAYTEEGHQVLENWHKAPRDGALAFLHMWTQQLVLGDTERAYRGTLDPSDRQRLQEKWNKAPSWIDFWRDGQTRELLAGKMHERYRAGSLVVPAADFYVYAETPEEMVQARQKVLEQVKACFNPETARVKLISVFDAVPFWIKGEKKVQFQYTAHMTLTEYVVEMRIWVEAERQALEKKQMEPWKVTRIELIRARRYEEGAKAKGGPTPRPMPGT